MTETIGNFSLVAATLASAGAVFSCVAAGRLDRAVWLKWARLGLLLTAAALTVASVTLGIALWNLDFRFAYVASHTERALPRAFRIAAFWAGQEGSLLLWAWLLTGLSLLAAWMRRRKTGIGEAATVGTLSAVCLFFSALLVFAADPFVLTPGGAAADGYGLNPQLQHWAMVAHPPVLFMGYAAFAVPFAIMIGALVAGRTDNAWAGELRRWVISAWLFLTAGIVLGAWWAYVELGWGGYWAWDPVENASLLPWLTGIALIHAIVIHEHRGMQKQWTASLAAGTFILCIFGTYITRSGVIQSVHAFGASLVGTFFLVFLLLLTASSIGVLLWRRGLLRSQTKMETVVGREGMFLLGNALLVIMAAVTLIGTTFPLLSSVFMNSPVSVGAPFYNRVVAPMGLLLAAVMAVGPILVYGAAAAGTLKRGLILPGIITVVAVVIGALAGLTNPAALATLAISVLAVSVMLLTFDRAVRTQMRRAGTGPVSATFHLLDANHRRYGGQLTHLGAILIILGVAGSSLYAVRKDLKLAPSETATVGGYTLRYDSLNEVPRKNHTAVQAHLTLVGSSGVTHVMTPEKRFYDKAENPSSEVSIRTGLGRDLYVALAGWEAGGAKVALQVLINPLVSWIWIGAMIVCLGALFPLSPRLLHKPHVAADRRPAGRQAQAGVLEPIGAK